MKCVQITNLHERGFTRWELLVLVVLLLLLAAIVIPVFSRPRTNHSLNACINNLRLIDSAKYQWALEKKAHNSSTPQGSDLQPYLGRGLRGELPCCPADPNQAFSTSYSINNIGAKPTCKIVPSSPSHILP